MMSLLVLLSAVFSVDAMINIKNEFEDWKMTHGKAYQTELENRYRFSVFSQNYMNIQLRNKKNRTVVLGVNKFADLTNEEFNQRYLNKKIYEGKSYEKLSISKSDYITGVTPINHLKHMNPALNQGNLWILLGLWYYSYY